MEACMKMPYVTNERNWDEMIKEDGRINTTFDGTV
jgi:hypothetical protein